MQYCVLELWESPNSKLGSWRCFGEEVFQAEEKVRPGLELRECSQCQSSIRVRYPDELGAREQVGQVQYLYLLGTHRKVNVTEPASFSSK